MIIAVLLGIGLGNGQDAELIVHRAEAGNRQQAAAVKQFASFTEGLVDCFVPDIGITLPVEASVIGDHDCAFIQIKIHNLGKRVVGRFGAKGKVGNIVLILAHDFFACGDGMDIYVVGFGAEAPRVELVQNAVRVGVAGHALAQLGEFVKRPLAVACQRIQVFLDAKVGLEVLIEQHHPGAVVVEGVDVPDHKKELAADGKILLGVLVPPWLVEIERFDRVQIDVQVIGYQQGRKTIGIEHHIVGVGA